MKADICIRNGTIVDPASGYSGPGDIFIRDGRIIRVTTKDEEIGTDCRAEYGIDAEGLHVLPGLIDFHTHFFFGGNDSSLPLDVVQPASGVTTAVDAGSTGYSNYRAFAASLAGSVTRTRAFLNVSPVGIATTAYPEEVDPAIINRTLLRERRDESGGHIVGLKVRINRPVARNHGLTPLVSAVSAGEDMQLPVSVHTTDSHASDVREILEILRPGDIYTHTFHGSGATLTDESGRVSPHAVEARNRGVLFDTGDGGGNFSFATAKAAFTQGFYPDIISTDATFRTIYREPVMGLPFVLSKYLSLGMPLMDVVRSATHTPAQKLGIASETGSLAPGLCADIALFALKEMEVSFRDSKGVRVHGSKLLIPMMTLRQGRIVYRNYEFLGCGEKE